MNRVEIPKLPEQCTLLEARAYLLWLGFSPWAYHIDESPENIDWDEPSMGHPVSSEDTDTLNDNMEAVIEAFKDKYELEYWEHIWEVYGEVMNDWRQVMNATFEELADGRTYGEKVTIMCEGIHVREACGRYAQNISEKEILNQIS